MHGIMNHPFISSKDKKLFGRWGHSKNQKRFSTDLSTKTFLTKIMKLFT